MLIDLLSMDNYVSFNIKLAEILGLHAAIYLSELLNINEKAVRKDKIEDNCFIIQRQYIKKRTTIPESEQKELDKMLVNIGVLKKSPDNPDKITLDLTVVTSLISAEPVTLKNLEKMIENSKPQKRTKTQVIIDQLKDKINVNNEELKQAYEEWIDAVYAKQGWMSVKSVVVGQRTVDEYCNHNLDLALQIIEIASINGYRDIQWAINTYEKDYKLSYRVPTATSLRVASSDNLSDEVF